jgi:hypothetical protein
MAKESPSGPTTRTHAIHDKVNSILFTLDLDTPLDRVLPHADVRCVIRYKHRQESTMEEFTMLKEEEEERRRKEEKKMRSKEKKKKERAWNLHLAQAGTSTWGRLEPPPGSGWNLHAAKSTAQGIGTLVPPSRHGRYLHPGLSGTSRPGTARGTVGGSGHPGHMHTSYR